MNNEDVTPAKIAREVVKELGGETTVAKICGIRGPSVYDWYRRGISQGNYRYLRLKFPHLKSWELEVLLPDGIVPYSSRQRIAD